MAEDAKFGDGYEAIFGKKGGAAKASGKAKPAAKKPAAKKPAAKKPAAKKK
jgi:DNA topoisomerase-1